eukprot:GILI01004468.1.p1 GENE.GILI01004468.1~~GILI01004468.1.p1  ORF type:complete len:418 (-),score=81.80 GILI01004468.1:41-1294(-)
MGGSGVEMSAAYFKQLLRSDRRLYYTTPELNDKLFLHYKGFGKIANLEQFTGVKVLYLEGNGFTKIEGLECCTQLRSLCLQENLIEKIEGLDNLTNLDSLNLSDNSIVKIENLKNCVKLNTLQLKRNRIGISGLDDVLHLLDLESVSVLDLSDNKIDDPDVLSEVLVKMKNLSVLYLQGNPVCKKIENYRKTVISAIPSLKYLDDRPVFDDDRRLAEAFCRGGVEEERAERTRIRDEKADKERKNHEAFKKMIEDARQARREGRDPLASPDTEASDVSEVEDEEDSSAADEIEEQETSEERTVVTVEVKSDEVEEDKCKKNDNIFEESSDAKEESASEVDLLDRLSAHATSIEAPVESNNDNIPQVSKDIFLPWVDSGATSLPAPSSDVMSKRMQALEKKLAENTEQSSATDLDSLD